MKTYKSLMKSREKYFIAVTVIILLLLKQWMVKNLPIFAISTAINDDRAMINLANSLIHFHWLGRYSYLTLIKGPFFPFFLAVVKWIGFSYLSAQTLIYSLSCVIFVYAIKDLFKSKFPLLLIFIVLLFNPISFSSDTLLRVYRNGLTLSQVLVLFGCTFAMYFRRNQSAKMILPWAIGSGIALATLWNTREDAIWVVPFVTVVLLILLINTAFSKQKQLNRRKHLTKLTVILLPILLLLASNGVISGINYFVYGSFSRVEVSEGAFGAAMKSIYSVKNKVNIDYVSVTREKMDRLYKISPTLRSIEEEMENSLNGFKDNGSNLLDNEVDDGWFMWAFRNAVNQAGLYSSSTTADHFYKSVSDEIELAKKNDLIASQPTMPSSMMSPWRDVYFDRLIDTMKQATEYIVEYKNVDVQLRESLDDGVGGIGLFETITNNRATITNQGTLTLTGWYVWKNNEETPILRIKDKGNVLKKLVLTESRDVAETLNSQSMNLKNAEHSRFSITIENIPLDYIVLEAVSQNGRVLETINLDGTKLNGNSSKSIFNFDLLSPLHNDQAVYLNSLRPKISILNQIAEFYKKTGLFLAISSLISFILMFIIMLVNLRKRDDSLVDALLCSSALLCSLAVLIGGVSYTQISAFSSINYFYLSGSYPLIIAFELISILKMLEFIVGKIVTLTRKKIIKS